ncbi:MAG: DNA translocase FtsK, partial [Eubacteriales bacterium]
MAKSKSSSVSNAQKKKSNAQKKSLNSKSTNTVNVIKAQDRSMAKRQRIAIIFMAVAIFSIFLVLIEGQNVWTSMHNGILGLFGSCAYVWPLMLIYMAIICALDKPLGSMTLSLFGMAAFMVLIGGAIHVLANTSEYLRDESIGLQISAAWAERAGTTNGGVFGAIIGGIIAKLFGKTGAQITIILVTAVMFMLLTGTTLFGLLRTIAKPVRKVSKYSGAKKEQKENAANDKSASKKSFNPPKVFDGSDKENFGREVSFSDEYVPIVPNLGFETTVQKREDMQVEISLPNFKNSESKPKFESGLPKAQKKTAVNDMKSNNDDQSMNKNTDIEDAKELKTCRLPPIECLNEPQYSESANTEEELRLNGNKLIETLKSFGVQAKILMISRGPSVTRYELQPEPGVRISRITNLAEDIALRLAASSVRIEAPIPNKSAIGVEVPNRSRANVSIREIIGTNQFRTAKSKLNVALGKDITGNVICADLVKMPHLLIAGTTGSGKSVCLNSMIVSLLYNATPDEVKLLLIDPKAVELAPYNGIAHLAVPVVSDARKAAGALAWAVAEMQDRYKLFTENNVKDIDTYNKLAEKSTEIKRMHKIVIIIDELNDLMMLAPNEVEDSICRLAQMARAAGMHLVVATQRPSVDVITGIIKANIPSRIALSVSAQVDSRTIID